MNPRTSRFERFVLWPIAGLLLLLFIGGTISCEMAKWRECRRYHPVWYCLDNGK